MAKTLFKGVNYSVSLLIEQIDNGMLGFPDIQRPFVWTSTQVRDLFDSMYRGSRWVTCGSGPRSRTRAAA